MTKKKVEKVLEQVESFLECWKQFNHYIGLAHAKKFKPEDEAHFLELKSLIVQQLEFVFAAIESGCPPKEDVLNLISGAPSLRFLSELPEQSLRALESQWHKIYIAWLSVLGQLKVHYQSDDSKSILGGILKGKKE